MPLHFTAFHPDYHMLETPPTPPATLQRARSIAIRNGLAHVYVGNVHDPARQATLCPTCGARAIGRDGYTITGLRARRRRRLQELRDKDGGRVRREARRMGLAAAAGRHRALRGVRARRRALPQRRQHLVEGAGGDAEHAGEGLAELENEEQRAADREGAEAERGRAWWR